MNITTEKNVKRVLSPFDLYNLCVSITEHPKNVLDDYCIIDQDPKTLLPVITLDTERINPDDPHRDDIICWLHFHQMDIITNEIKAFIAYKSDLLSKQMKLLVQKHPENEETAQYLINVMLYQNYDLRKPFLIQYEKNVNNLIGSLNQL